MLTRLILAIVIFVVVGLVLVYLLGPLLLAMGLPFVNIIGEFFVRWGWLLALAAGIWHFFTSGPLVLPWRRP